ncbi:hypothetical protein OROGR_018002 [Orobanche gracilis]
MSVRSATRHHCKKAFLMGLSLFRRGFKTSKCKTMAKMATARVKLLRNKREVVIKQIRRDIAMLLESGQDATARIRVDHVIREQNIMAANELIELFCELVVARLSIIAKQRECPADLKEGISSLIFAAPRCSDIPELLSIRDVFQKKYGKDFVSAATDLRSNAGVNRMLIEKLSVKTPSGEIKLKVLKEIAKEYQIQWDTTESEELLKPPEERIEGPERFVSAASLPLKPAQTQYPQPIYNTSDRGESNIMSFQYLAGVAAEKALAASEAAAVLAAASNQGVSHLLTEYPTGDQRMLKTNGSDYSNRQQSFEDDGIQIFRRQNYNCQRAHKFDEEIEMDEAPPPSSGDARKITIRRHSYNVPRSADIARYDESDEEEVLEYDQPTNRAPDCRVPQVPAQHVHPKLPDYKALAARFEALKLFK